MTASVLILRPEPGASQTAGRARALGLDPIVYPLFQVEPRAWTGPDPASVDALLFTSANAARHGGAGLARYRALPSFAVGAATERAVRAAGFAEVISGRSNAQDIAREIARRGHSRLLHIAGRDVRAFDAGLLRVTRVEAYESVAIGDMPGLAAARRDAAVALVHSVRTVRRLAAFIPLPDRASLAIVAISRAAAEAAGVGWARVCAVDSPDDNAMLALAARLCK